MARSFYLANVGTWSADIGAEEKGEFRDLVQKRHNRYEAQPLATFYDGLNFVEKRPLDTQAEQQTLKPRVFYARQEIIGGDVADYSTLGVMIEKRPELVRNFDDEN